MKKIMVIALVNLLLLALVSAYFYFIYAPLPIEPKLSALIKPGKIMTGQGERKFLAYIPEELRKEAGLVIALHGTGMNSQKMREWTGFEFEEMADQNGFAIVYPAGYKGNWNDCRKDAPFAAKLENIDDVGFLKDLIDQMVKQYHIDANRIYVFGFSNGGQMGYRLASEMGDKIKGVAAIAAGLPTEETCSCNLSSPTGKIMLVAGTKDPINPYAGGKVSLFGLKKVGEANAMLVTAESFALRNGLIPKAAVNSLPLQIKPVNKIYLKSWKKEGVDFIRLYTLENAGHVIPQQKFRFPRIMGNMGGDFDSPVEALKFFGLMK
jgi:polyhydroxybutyrate depolymerase